MCVIVVVWFFSLCEIRLDISYERKVTTEFYSLEPLCATTFFRQFSTKKKLWNYAPNEKCREILSMTCAICMLLFKLFIIIGRHSRPEGATHIQSSCLAFSCLFHVARLKCVQMNTNSNRFNFCSFVFRWKKVYFIFQRVSSLLSLFYVVFFCCCIAFQIAVNKSCFAVHSNRHF